MCLILYNEILHDVSVSLVLYVWLLYVRKLSASFSCRLRRKLKCCRQHKAFRNVTGVQSLSKIRLTSYLTMNLCQNECRVAQRNLSGRAWACAHWWVALPGLSHGVWIRCERLEWWNQRRNALFTNVLNNLKCAMLPFRTVKTHRIFAWHNIFCCNWIIWWKYCNVSFLCNVFFFLCNFNSNAFLLFFFLSLSSLWCYRYSLSNLCHICFYQRKNRICLVIGS